MSGDSYCILIPHYRHDRELARYLPKLATAGLPALVVDDGSDAGTLARLRALVAAHPWTSLFERARNGGKGAAMVSGMRRLASNGFTHAVSVDADGQHDPADVGRALRASRRDPGAVFAGKPVFGPDIPAARLHGRKLTNALANIEAGARIDDAMCGFRVYPLASILPLCASIGTRRRMEFDIEILVRAVWAGLPVRFFPTRVVYPEGGRSHFRMARDNLRLSWMHAMLLLQGAARRLRGTRPTRHAEP